MKQDIPVSLMALFCAQLKRDLSLAYAQRSNSTNVLIFFMLVVSLFPLGVSPLASVLASIASGILWVAALLAALLSVNNLFQQDYEDGCLEQMLLSPQPLFLVVLAKVTAHWLLTGLPLALIAPLLSMMLFLPESGLFALFLGLLIGTASLSLIGAIGAALILKLRNSGVLISLLILPLYIPILLFGSSLVGAAIEGAPWLGYLALLGAILALSILLAPWAASAALKISLSE